MGVPRHKHLFAPFGALALAAASLAFAAPAGAASGDGTPVDQLIAGPSLSVGELMARANLKIAQAEAPAKAAKKAEKKAKHKAVSVALDELLQSPPMTFGELLAKTGARSAKGAPAGIATELPQAVKTTTVAEAPTATVTIPAAPRAEPVVAKAPEKAVAVAPKAAPRPKLEDVLATAPLTLEIRETEKGLTFKPESLAFSKAGMTATMKITGKDLDGLSLFVRDQKVVDLKRASNELKALKKGVTELYAVAKGHMYIVPVTVAEGDAGGDLEMKVPDALVSLDGVFQGSMQSALFPGVEQATAAAGAKTGAALPQGPSLQDSVAETAQSMLRQAHEAERFYNAKEQLGYKAVTIQLIDDRSNPAAGRIYPVANATVSVVGTEFRAQTDSTGHLTIRDMPQKSRFLLRIDDSTGTVRPAVIELATKEASGVQRLRVMRNFSFETYASIAGAVQNTALGSYCATVTDHDDDGKADKGVSVQADAQADGPYYFNDYGFLDRSVIATGSDGRFCFFNVQPGPMALSFYENQALVASLPVSIYTGRHVEDDVELGHESRLATRLASMPTAQEQLSNDPRAAASYKQIDMIDLIPLGTQEPMMQLAPGQVSAQDALPVHSGRLRAFAQAAEFEPTVYSYAEGDQQSVTPLIPRGFVEDMAVYAQVTHNPELGTVLAEYAAPDGAAQEAIAMRLVDEYGHDVGDGWYFSDTPVTKAIFFNVPAGTYGLLVETKDGYWLGSDTVIVYNETVSFARMGNVLRYRR